MRQGDDKWQGWQGLVGGVVIAVLTELSCLICQHNKKSTCGNFQSWP